MTAPTRPIGQVDPYAMSTYGPYDLLETVPDLQPGLTAVRTYAEMRRDARIAAILQGYGLQLRRAQWQLDTVGCRPEVVRLVADDMGLPVKGDDSPGAARTRGVSWNEHLRTGLLHLSFGFMPFELVAEMVGGQARLVALAARMPLTVESIHADPATGALLGADQSAVNVGGLSRKPQIPADRLCWYVNDREGASWAGTPIIRAAYAPWLIKRELMRIHAMASRRWGIGVPVMEALPGSTPTPGQMQEAQQLASAARAGEQAGAAVPPGFTMKIVGMSGSVPDTLAYIRWLDTQIAQQALMNHLDLGISESGSRALASEFLDTLMMAMGAIAENIADTATRQVSARIVGWNFGADEPVPKVTVAGIGQQRDITAESLQLLLSSGALQADPGLESWVRREYRLPEREGMAEPAPSVAGDTLAAANRTPKAPAATTPPRRGRGRKTVAAGQMSLVLNATQAADFDQLQSDWEQARQDLLEQWPTQSSDLVGALAAAAAAAVVAGALADLGSLQVDSSVIGAIAAFLDTAMTALAEPAAAAAVAELADAGQDTAALDDPGGDRIGPLSEAHAGQLAGGYAAAAGRKALTLAGPDADRDLVEAAVRAHLEDMSSSAAGLAGDTFGAALSAAQQVARRDVFAAFPDATYRAVEVNDSRQCAACKEIDQAEFQGLAAAEAAYPAGGYVLCAGGARCRGTYTIKAI